MLEQQFLHQKQFSLQLRTEAIKTRLEHLDRLEQLVLENQSEICRALHQDFQKPELETLLSEVYPLLSEIKHIRKHLKKWMKPKKVSSPILILSAHSSIHYEPRGVCLIIAPWNYPVYLSLIPLASALAAGNCVTIKPSEMTRHTSSLIHKLITKYFQPEHVSVVLGGVETSQELLKLPFDHIFFTGSTQVGKIVMAAAAKNLSSVTLELGGKSPTIVDCSANLPMAAERIAWAKFLNAGQTCVAPDYLFVQEHVYTEFVELLRKQLERNYGASLDQQKNTPDFARLVSRHHTERLTQILGAALADGAEIIAGGQSDTEQHFIAPTLLGKVSPKSQIMQEEIFGPLLPILKYKDLSEVIHFINDRPKPLALYFYSQGQIEINRITQETSSGGLVINDSVIHLINPNLPFGGVGPSGMGSAHGHFGFKTFSHEKAVVRQGFLGKLGRLTYPPYTARKLKILKTLIRWRL